MPSFQSSAGITEAMTEEISSKQTSVHADLYAENPGTRQDVSIILDKFEWQVLIIGTFLKTEDVENCKWSCMFGEVEVPAEVVGDGILSCHAPSHKSGRVPFYVTCSNRLACSEVREFEFRVSDPHCIENIDSCSNNTYEMLLHMRLDKLLSLGPPLDYQNLDYRKKAHLGGKISLIKMESGYDTLPKISEENGYSADNAELLEMLLREKLHIWLLHKATEDDKEMRMGGLHYTGQLFVAGEYLRCFVIKISYWYLSIVNHIYCCFLCHFRERTVGALITMGAAPGLLTDPTPEFPSGRTPADLASANGHKGIAGFLAESSLTSHLSSLTLDPKGSDIPDFASLTGIDDAEQSALAVADGDLQAGLSLKDSLSAVRNASQAAARIYQVFRVQSFHRKKIESAGDKSVMSDEQALSLLSIKSQKTGQSDMPMHAAAIRIQNKFRGWKGRKDFLIIRQRIVKIQV
ncbi:hypothetical protein BHE74_00023313 [Ensete ventricosum]|nr:hypothetical protein BHE74_00023313 [Ensete ventricosum]